MPRELITQAPPAGSARALVLDTNVVLDLLVFADPATHALSSALDAGAFQWIATSGMRSELERVLGYPKIAPKVAQLGWTPDAVLAQFDAAVHMVPPAPIAAFLCQDADDQPFIDLAVAHKAIVLSKDKAVLCLHKRLLAEGAQAASRLASEACGTPDVGTHAKVTGDT